MPQIDGVQSVIDAQQREFPRLDYSAKAIAARLVRLTSPRAGKGRDGKAYILAARAAEAMQALKIRLTSATKLSIMKIAFRVISLPGAVSLALEAAAGANPEASARRDPEQMNGLVLLGATGGLPRLLPVGDGD
jgi:hypothetical protein